MATSGFCSDDEDKVDSLLKWPLEYEGRTKEYNCGWCGQALDHTADDLELHFKNCKNSKEKGFLMILAELRKMKQKYEVLKAEMDEMKKLKAEAVEEIKAEIRNEMEINKSEFDKKISDLKAEIKKHSETEIKCREASDVALSTLFRKVKDLEEGAKEKMTEVSGVTISTLVHSVLEEDKASLADTKDPAHSKKETKSLKTGLEGEIARLEMGTETVSNDPLLLGIKTHLEGQCAKPEEKKILTKKTKSLYVEPSSLDQLTIPNNCFIPATRDYLAQPSIRWPIRGIPASTAQKALETSRMVGWSGYPVQKRANSSLTAIKKVYKSRKTGSYYVNRALA